VITLADLQRLAQGAAQRQGMAENAQGAEHIGVAHGQAQTLFRQQLQGALNHAGCLAVGDAQAGILQILEIKTQATAQRLAGVAALADHLGQGLQQKRRKNGSRERGGAGIGIHAESTFWPAIGVDYGAWRAAQAPARRRSSQAYTGQRSTSLPPRSASSSPNCSSTDSLWVGRRNTWSSTPRPQVGEAVSSS